MKKIEYILTITELELYLVFHFFVIEIILIPIIKILHISFYTCFHLLLKIKVFLSTFYISFFKLKIMLNILNQ